MNLPQLTAEASLYSSVGYWPANGRATVSRSPARQLIYPSQSESTGTGGDGGGGGTGGGDGGSQTSGTGANTTCPPGYTLVDGVCSEVINVHGCPPGYIDLDGHCLPNEIITVHGTIPSQGSQSSGGTGNVPPCTFNPTAGAPCHVPPGTPNNCFHFSGPIWDDPTITYCSISNGIYVKERLSPTGWACQDANEKSWSRTINCSKSPSCCQDGTAPCRR
jgi:hypothetical protein